MSSISTRDVKIRNDVLKLLYATMLVELTPAQVKAFWRNHPYKLGNSALEDSQLLRHIWDESQHTDLVYLLSVCADLEPFLAANGIETLKFVDKFIVGLNKGSIVGAAAILGAFAPFLKFLFSSKDVVHFATEQILPFIVRKLAPSVQCEMVKHAPRSGRTSSVVLLNFNDSAKMELPPYDPYLFAARPLLFGPLRLGMAPLDDASVLSDTRKVETIVGQNLVEYTSRGVSIAKRHIGSFIEFNEYCKRLGLSLNGLAASNRRVVEITESYFCPDRKREVLFKGCVYGAPFCLIEVGYKNRSQPKDEFLAPLVHESTSAAADGWKIACAAHDVLLENWNEKLFLYSTSLRLQCPLTDAGW